MFVVHGSVRRRLALSLVAAIALGSLAACAGTPLALAGRTFVSTSIDDRGVSRGLVRGTRIELTFTADQLTASAGCNTLSAPYQLQDARLVLGALATTEMGCDAARSAQDAWLAELLRGPLGVTLAGDDLTLEAGGVTVKLGDRRRVEPDASLAGPTWRVEAFVSDNITVSSPGGVRATLVFHADGTFDINTGCNTGGGTFSIDGSSLHVGDIALTKKACMGDMADLERFFLSTLRSATLTVAIDHDRLLLRADGQGIDLRAS